VPGNFVRNVLEKPIREIKILSICVKPEECKECSKDGKCPYRRDNMDISFLISRNDGTCKEKEVKTENNKEKSLKKNFSFWRKKQGNE